MRNLPNWASVCLALAGVSLSAADGRIVMAVVGTASTENFEIVALTVPFTVNLSE